jgi:1-acyl-sn-glycerol-3-phosphate acyltransferase
MELSGQEYVDLYGAKVKKSMDTTGASAKDAVGRLQPRPQGDADRLPDSLAG